MESINTISDSIMFQFSIILFIHFIADFIVQTDWMAKNKSTSSKALSSHVLSYGGTFIVLYPLFYSLFGTNFQTYASFIVINVVLHGIIDFITSRIASKFHKEGKIHNFFVTIGFDQFLHTIIFINTYYLFFIRG